MKEKATAVAPASVANVFVGFDILGFSLPILYDKVRASKSQKGVKINSVTGVVQNLPIDPEKNTAGNALLKMISDEGIDFGFELDIVKGIPLSSGLGGSAASAVAAVVAANELLPQPLAKAKLLQYALEGESVASGSLHGDNVGASLYGGLVACLKEGERSDQFRVIPVPVYESIHCVIIHPNLVMETRKARQIIKPEVSLDTYVRQSMKLTQFLAGMFNNDLELLASSLHDLIIEPQRSPLIPKFDLLKSISLGSGALGFTIAGAGPSMFAWCENLEQAEVVREAINKRVNNLPYALTTWVTQLDTRGAYLLEEG
jgi:homoserine kinase